MFKPSIEESMRAHGVVVSHPLSMREALGSIPSVSIFLFVKVFQRPTERLRRLGASGALLPCEFQENGESIKLLILEN